MLGDRGHARKAANKAAGLAPDLARAQTILGFCDLAEFRAAEANLTFEQAIRLESADPMAHFRLGLGENCPGRTCRWPPGIETAVALDSNSALLRSIWARLISPKSGFRWMPLNTSLLNPLTRSILLPICMTGFANSPKINRLKLCMIWKSLKSLMTTGRFTEAANYWIRIALPEASALPASTRI